jgi:hypothetical protein
MNKILNDINRNIKILIQQNKEIKNSFVQTGENCQQIQTQNNFGSYNIVKPLVLNNKNNRFRVYDNIVNKTDVIYSSIAFFIIGSFFAKFIVGLDIGIAFFKIVFTFIVGWILFIFFKRFFGRKNYFILNDDKVILDSEKYIEMSYENIRSYFIEKALHGYSIYLYKIDEVEPEIEFNIESIHHVNAIEEFLKYKLQSKK